MSEEQNAQSRAPRSIMTEAFWEKAVLLGTGLVLAMLAGCVIWLARDTDTVFAEKLESAWRIMVIAGGLLTLLTVVWRGLIATRQADQQREQLEKIQRQIEQTDENNLAGLLQRGAESIADSDQESHASAGIAILQSIATARNDRFATPALDLLATFVERQSGNGHTDSIVMSAISAMNRAHDDAGRYASRSMRCRAEFDADEIDIADRLAAAWMPIRGVLWLYYEGGIVEGNVF